jgi:homotetrameric cytidine deaminase
MPATVDWDAMVRGARRMLRRAYTPYSRNPAGAAVLGDSGAVFLGCTVENASLGLTVSAAHSAVAQAIAAGEEGVRACAVALPGNPGPLSCTCCEVLAEFGAPSLPVVVVGKGKTRQVYALGDLTAPPLGRARG